MNTTQQTLTAKDVTPEKIDASKQHDDPFNVEDLDFGRHLGPQAMQIYALFKRIQTLTGDEVHNLSEAHREQRDTPIQIPTHRRKEWTVARYMLCAVISVTETITSPHTYDLTNNKEPSIAFRKAIADLIHQSTIVALHGAVAGLLCRNEIKLSHFTQNEYDHHTGPWRRTIGQIHPDDPRLP